MSKPNILPFLVRSQGLNRQYFFKTGHKHSEEQGGGGGARRKSEKINQLKSVYFKVSQKKLYEKKYRG